MVETQSDQFLSHRTSAYIISLLSPPRVPPLQHRRSMLAIGLQTRVLYLHRARLQKAAADSTSHHLESSCRSCRGRLKQSRRCLNMFHVSQNTLKMLQNKNDRPTEAVMVQSRSISFKITTGTIHIFQKLKSKRWEFLQEPTNTDLRGCSSTVLTVLVVVLAQ